MGGNSAIKYFKTSTFLKGFRLTPIVYPDLMIYNIGFKIFKQVATIEL